MMRIDYLKTSPDRVGRYLVRFSDGSGVRLYRQTVEDFALFTGKEFTEEEYEKFRDAVGQMSAKMRAVRIVAASSVSRRDLEQRLVQKGENPEQAKEAVQWMSELNLVDDRQTAEQIVSRCIAKGYGKARAKQALYEKKIPKSYWEEVLRDYPDQNEKIVEYLSGHLGDNPSDKDVKRCVDALLRRGHSWSAVKQALSEISRETEKFQEE